MDAKTEKLGRFIALLSDIFELDKAELDFGIYRIMNLRRNEISEFLSNGLPRKAREALADFAPDTAGMKARIAEIEKQAAEIGFDISASNLAGEYARLKSQIAAGRDLDAIETDVYSALHNFFGRYYDEGDFISKRRYKEGVYAIPYGGEEVKLHWANSDQYYIKTAENFRDYSFVADGKKVHFRTVAATAERDNNKETGAKRVFMLHGERPVEEEGGELVIRFAYDFPADKKKKYAEENLKAISDAILKRHKGWRGLLAPAPGSKDGKRSVIEKHLGAYAAKNTFDYFIHKDLRGFLARELDFFIKSEVLHLDDIDTADAGRAGAHMGKARAVKRVGRLIIDFLAQLEEFQKRLWLKKKFVAGADWCVTLDLVGEGFYPEIVGNAAQAAEWVEMYAIDEIAADVSGPGYTEPLTAGFLRRNGNLVLDTRHFSADFKERLLAGFDDLDGRTAGLLVHGENFQALNLLREKYAGQVKCVYIDPPFNTDASPIMYKNGYKDSTWLSLIEDRLIVGRPLLMEKGILAFAIDDYEMRYAHTVIDKVYDGNELGVVAIRNNPSGRPVPTGFAIAHEYTIFYGNSRDIVVSKIERTEELDKRYKEQDKDGRFMWELLRKRGSDSERSDSPKAYYPIYYNGDSFRLPQMEWNEGIREWENIEPPQENEIVCLPIDENGVVRRWRWGIETTADNLGSLKFKDGTMYYKYRPPAGLTPSTNWIDAKYSSTEHGTGLLKNYFSEYSPFTFPKSLYAIEDILRVAGADESSLVLDYFAGSGTTGHAVLNLNRADGGSRKYILVEMGEYFGAVTLPRMKKAVYCADWKAGKPQNRNTGTSHMMKYVALESYEDALSNIELSDEMAQLRLHLPDEGASLAYTANHMLGAESRDSMPNLDAFAMPFAYSLKIGENNETKDRPVDLPETFNYLLGLAVARQSAMARFSAAPLAEAEREAEGLYEGAVRLSPDAGGEFAFKRIEGRLPDGRRALVIWRDVTDDLLLSNAALDAYFLKNRAGPAGPGFDVVFVNGDSNLESLRPDGESWKVQRIEPVFKKMMFGGAQ